MYFQAQNLRTEANILKRVQIRGADDLVRTAEVIEIKQIKPGAYGYEDLHDGDVIELTGRKAEKCKAVERAAKAKDEQPALRTITKKEIDDKGLTILKPNAKSMVEPCERGSPQWLEQRAQYRRR